MNTNYKPTTYFDSPDRSNEQELQSDKQLIINQPLIFQLLEGYPSLAVILNRNRQIVAYNSKAAGLLFADQSGENFILFSIEDIISDTSKVFCYNCV
ncbi:MAG: hypothetical protein ABI638_01680 [Ignavibacteriota bacterium]